MVEKPIKPERLLQAISSVCSYGDADEATRHDRGRSHASLRAAS